MLETLSSKCYLLLMSVCLVEVIHYGLYPVLKYLKIICDVTQCKGPIMSRMKNAPACAQPSDPNDTLSILIAAFCT